MRKPIALLFLAALAVVAVQAMALATRYFQPWLDGDYLLPQRFAADVLGGIYPLSGWTLSSSPYLFPDFAISLLWHAVLGGAPLLPFYVVTSYVALALLTGWSLERVHASQGLGWLAGALLVNLLLACQGAADHARWLWWLGTATFHGGAVLLGLAQFALWAGPPDTAPSRARSGTATTLLFLGLASDTLLLTQFVLPLGLALFITAGRPRWRAPRVRAFVTAVVIAVGLIAVFRGALLLADWWSFPNVVRYAPTPSAITATTGRMLTDLTGPVPTAVPGFVSLFLLGTTGALWLAWRSATSTSPEGDQNRGRKLVIHYMTSFRAGSGSNWIAESRQAGWFAVTGLLSTLALPVLAVYWHNPQHGRYLLPCLVLPLWWLLPLLPLAKLRTPFVAGLVTASLLGLTLWRAPQIDFSKWTWPYPEQVAELDRFLSDGRHTRGLADFWNAQYLSTISHAKLRLNQVRPDGRVQFWGNNAFHHFEADSADGSLRAPLYTFILANGLDPAALRAKFGEPARTVTVGGYDIWLYDEPGAQRISALVDTEVRAFLGDRPGTERIAPP